MLYQVQLTGGFDFSMCSFILLNKHFPGTTYDSGPWEAREADSPACRQAVSVVGSSALRRAITVVAQRAAQQRKYFCQRGEKLHRLAGESCSSWALKNDSSEKVTR